MLVRIVDERYVGHERKRERKKRQMSVVEISGATKQK
jgi:hypothetical protein